MVQLLQARWREHHAHDTESQGEWSWRRRGCSYCTRAGGEHHAHDTGSWVQSSYRSRGVAVVSALERNTTLTTLELNGNDLGKGFGVAVASALERNTTLTTLELGINRLGEVSGVAIAGALEKNTTLTKMDLDKNISNYKEIQDILSKREPPPNENIPMVKAAIPPLPR